MRIEIPSITLTFGTNRKRLTSSAPVQTYWIRLVGGLRVRGKWFLHHSRLGRKKHFPTSRISVNARFLTHQVRCATRFGIKTQILCVNHRLTASRVIVWDDAWGKVGCSGTCPLPSFTYNWRVLSAKAYWDKQFLKAERIIHEHVHWIDKVAQKSGHAWEKIA